MFFDSMRRREADGGISSTRRAPIPRIFTDQQGCDRRRLRQAVRRRALHFFGQNGRIEVEIEILSHSEHLAALARRQRSSAYLSTPSGAAEKRLLAVSCGSKLGDQSPRPSGFFAFGPRAVRGSCVTRGGGRPSSWSRRACRRDSESALGYGAPQFDDRPDCRKARIQAQSAGAGYPHEIARR